MQTPAPFDYERATSVEGAIASLQRLGGEARLIAGGHSLLPMMKLRLATPAHLIDINDLHELSYIREEGDELAIGALTRHVELLESELLAERFPRLPRRRAGDRRPGRAQPRHDRRLAVPGRRGRGPVGRLRRAQGARSSSAARTARASSAMSEFHVGPWMTAVGDGELVTEVRLPLRAGRRQRAREGRAARGRLGDRGRLGRRVDGRRHDRRRRHRPQRRRPDHDRADPRGGAAARRRRRRTSCSRRRPRSPPRTARRSPTPAGRSTTSATSRACSPNAPCAVPRPARSSRRPERCR